LEFRPSSAIIQDRLSHCGASAFRHAPSQLQERARKFKGAISQIVWGVRLALQHCQYVPRLQCGSDAAANRLSAIAADNPNMHTERTGDR
jgi:hypothetical protein